ncbi:hypothetical protein BROUX41_000395 [Berkeleyomyces rouxiae]|uniref:uncharacterized protein n=1 Tax=Berkeleyomyces rouxiae TaxID=2035830 RepID=UPI003B7B00EF
MDSDRMSLVFLAAWTPQATADLALCIAANMLHGRPDWVRVHRAMQAHGHVHTIPELRDYFTSTHSVLMVGNIRLDELLRRSESDSDVLVHSPTAADESVERLGGHPEDSALLAAQAETMEMLEERARRQSEQELLMDLQSDLPLEPGYPSRHYQHYLFEYRLRISAQYQAQALPLQQGPSSPRPCAAERRHLSSSSSPPGLSVSCSSPQTRSSSTGSSPQ